MHHMTANWVPIGLRERNQRCFGVWGTVGSTGRWPEVVNMWELNGWDGLVANLEHELGGQPTMQDPSLAEWWAAAADMRRGGFDRVCIPAPWTRTIDELIADDVRGEVYAHELVSLPPGMAGTYLDALADEGVGALESMGASLVAAMRVAMRGDDECVVIWAFPDLATWGAFERAQDANVMRRWRDALGDVGASWHRTLMVDAPLAPLRIRRQPEESDR
jgi:hypothetical protein